MVATRPVPRPPYQELIITAAKNSVKWLGSARYGNSNATARASPTLATAIPYRTMGGRLSINICLHQLEKLCSVVAETGIEITCTRPNLQAGRGVCRSEERRVGKECR